MNNDQILALKKCRLSTLESRGTKNIKCGGVVRKLRRQIRSMEA